jgi:hypothetical protein
MSGSYGSLRSYEDLMHTCRGLQKDTLLCFDTFQRGIRHRILEAGCFYMCKIL